MKKIALLTSQNLDGYVHDDHLLIQELTTQGYAVKSKAWETLKDEGEDLFLIRTTWNYTDHLDQFFACLENIKDRLWNPLSLVKWNSNKKYLLELQNKGVNVIPLLLAHDNNSLIKCLNQLGGDEFIAKPLVSASAKGLLRFHRAQLPDIKNEMIIQSFLPEINQGEVSLIYFGGNFSYAVKKTPKKGDIRVQEEHGGQITPHQPTDEELDIASHAFLHIPEKWLYARIDIVPGVGLIEIECIEPSLYFSKSKCGAQSFVKEIAKHI